MNSVVLENAVFDPVMPMPKIKEQELGIDDLPFLWDAYAEDDFGKIHKLPCYKKQKVAEQTQSLKELLAMKTEFLNTVSHQLRTPTTIFRSMLSMITEGSLTKEQKEEWINDCYGAANRLLIIKVQDTGIGLTQEDKEILFQKFERGRGSWGMNVNSSGLGLYIAKRIVEGHHGEITAESEGEDKGSIFTITLPIMQEI